jgi:AcrR family transcriptional regulator
VVTDRAPQLLAPLDVLWGRRDERTRRGGAQLSRERIVAAAVTLADCDGLAGVSMARVADELGTAPMSLYRHVESKDELVALMLEAGLGEAPDLARARTWRSRLERWAAALLDVVQRHRWALELPLARMPFGPRRAAWLDRGLAALAATPLREDEKAALVLLVNDYVFSHARLDEQLADSDTQPLLPADVDATRYPALRKAIDAGLFAGAGRDRAADFKFGLTRILDGIDRLVERKSRNHVRDVTRASAGDEN